MLKAVNDITAIVIDSGGNYVAMAQRLARDYKKVYYCCNWITSFPKYNSYVIGMNVPNIERVDHWAEVIDECDMAVFPDLYQGALQDWFVSKGIVVFGARIGEGMELYRDFFKDLLKDAGLNVNEHKVLYGFDQLEKFLHKNPDQYVKTSLIRGNGETFHYIDQRLSESRLTELKHQLGAFKDEAVFVCESPIENAIEIGYDGFFVNGDNPDMTLAGIEIKDAGYVGAVVEYRSLPMVLKDINTKLRGFFAGAGYKCFFSNEVRWTGKKGYFIDATTRVGQPPGDLQMEIFKDYSRYIWEIANGIVPEIEATQKYGAQIIIKSDWATSEPQAVYYPSQYADRIKIKNLMYKDKLPHFIPGDVDMCEIGSVVGLGDTMEAAIADAKKIAETVEGDCVSCNSDALDDAAEQINKLESFNIKLF
jgi:phosphoribosylamine-glycine ligase